MSQKVQLKKQQVEDIISTHYGLTVHSLKKIRGIYQVMTDRGCYSFKNAEEIPDLPLVNRCLGMIREHGFSCVPELIPTLNGDPSVSYVGQNYYLDRWVDGYELPEELLIEQRLGAALAKFHSASQALVIPQDSPRYNYGKRTSFLQHWNIKLRSWLQEIAAYHGIDTEMLDFLKYRCQLAYAYIQDIPIRDRSVLPALCHGSLHHENILIDRDNNIWFIDFESMAYAERTLDLAQFIHYYAPPFEWKPAVIHRILNSYQANHTTSLSRAEFRYFLSYLAFPRQLYNAAEQYFDQRPGSRRLLLKLKEVIEREWLKERFLSSYEPALLVERGYELVGRGHGLDNRSFQSGENDNNQAAVR